MSKAHFKHDPKNPMLTTREAAALMSVSPRTIQLWVEGGKLLAGRTPGGHRRIRYSDVQELGARCGIVVPEPSDAPKPAKPSPRLAAVATLLVPAGGCEMQVEILAAGERLQPGNYVLHVISTQEALKSEESAVLGAVRVRELRDREMRAYRDGIYASEEATAHRLAALIREVEKAAVFAERCRVADAGIGAA